MGPSQDPRIKPSIYNRLVDPESGGTQKRPWYSVEQMKRAVQEDIDKLLNTRRSVTETGERYQRVQHALGYGMPDITSLNFLTDTQREGLARWMEEAIERYEPRLRDVRVTLREPDKTDVLKVKFHMEGRLSMDPAPPVLIDHVLELTSGHFIDESRARGEGRL